MEIKWKDKNTTSSELSKNPNQKIVYTGAKNPNQKIVYTGAKNPNQKIVYTGAKNPNQKIVYIGAKNPNQKIVYIGAKLMPLTQIHVTVHSSDFTNQLAFFYIYIR
jgi:hypothetical protein